ncbi:MAG: GNAT family N-acetyltransferase [Oscillospiraceae bacterium]|jgi:ribosomal protein S18 acetylase RimI-like enzyme|nr:GNAT family N-acetyltransferase [Oscillospiraceae bacterium]
MAIELIAYKPRHKRETLRRMADFFGYHRALYDGEGKIPLPTRETRKTLKRWTAKGHSLYVVCSEGVSVGFARIGWRGGNVAWIEDIYIDREQRGKGIASRAIACAEKVIAKDRNYDAVCMDVSPRNEDALRLYARLGYTNISMLTLRKELYENDMDREVNFLGFEFTY